MRLQYRLDEHLNKHTSVGKVACDDDETHLRFWLKATRQGCVYLTLADSYLKCSQASFEPLILYPMPTRFYVYPIPRREEEAVGLNQGAWMQIVKGSGVQNHCGSGRAR
jgi:hypothetical protein